MVFVGRKYELIPDTRAYPRYHFFRSKLKDVFNRVDNALFLGMDTKITLWQFLLELLVSNQHTEIIQWTDNDGEFKLVNPEEVANLWGKRTNNPSMNYDKLSRSLRYYYTKNIIKKAVGEYMYEFLSFPGIVMTETKIPFKQKMEKMSDQGQGQSQDYGIMAESNNKYRLSKLLTDGGTYFAKELLKVEFSNAGFADINALLNDAAVQDKIHRLHTQPRKVLHQSQMDLLYPASGTANIDDLDITLLTCILTNCFELSASKQTTIADLRTIRNEFLGHTSSYQLDENTFKQQWQKVASFLESESNKYLSSDCVQHIIVMRQTIEGEILTQEAAGKYLEEKTRTSEEREQQNQVKLHQMGGGATVGATVTDPPGVGARDSQGEHPTQPGMYTGEVDPTLYQVDGSGYRNPNTFTDDEIKEYSEKLGSGWEIFAIYLGYRQQQIDNLKDTYPRQIETLLLKMLQKWHNEVAKCKDENPRDLLAAAFVEIHDSLTALKILRGLERLPEMKKLKPKPETVKKIQQIKFTTKPTGAFATMLEMAIGAGVMSYPIGQSSVGYGDASQKSGKNHLVDFITLGRQTWFYIKDAVRTCLNQSGNVSIYVFASDPAHLDNIQSDLIRDMSIFDTGEMSIHVHPKESAEEKSENRQSETADLDSITTELIRKMSISDTGEMSKPPPETIEEKSEDWQSFVTEGVTEYSPQVIVYVKGQQELGSIVEGQIQVLPQIKQDRLVIYDATNKTSYLYKSPDQDTMSLCLNVEFLLERNVIQLLELIADFIRKFIPGGVDRKLSSDEVGEKIVNQLKKSLKKKYVLNDFIPVSTDEDQYSEELQAEKSVLTGDKRQEAIFWIKIRNFVSRKVKCEFCDLTAKRLGIPGTFLNEFLGDNFFGLEKRIQGMISSDNLPRWPLKSVLQSSIKRVFRNTFDFFNTVCSEMILEAEKYISNMYTVLRGFQKYLFEIRGLLRRSPRAVSREVPSVQRISRSLQNDILDVDNVEACGNLYGTLTVIVNRQLTTEQRTKIETIIKNHRHTALYDIAITDGWNQQTPFVAPGNGIVCKFIPGGKDKFIAKLKEESKELSDNVKGTLGCFVEPETGNGLYGVTCYHCVDEEYFHANVKAISGQEEIELGNRSFGLYHQYTLDVALVKVHENMRENCEKRMTKADGNTLVGDWKFSKRDEIELEQLHVYKKGLISGTTSGIVAGAQFKTKDIKNLEDTGFRLKTEQGEDIKLYNIFVDGSPGGGEFSEYGDSGSVVCMEEISNDAAQESTVEVISLLYGDITVGGNTYSYSCPMRKLLRELKKEYPECPVLREAIHRD